MGVRVGVRVRVAEEGTQGTPADGAAGVRDGVRVAVRDFDGVDEGLAATTTCDDDADALIFVGVADDDVIKPSSTSSASSAASEGSVDGGVGVGVREGLAGEGVCDFVACVTRTPPPFFVEDGEATPPPFFVEDGEADTAESAASSSWLLRATVAGAGAGAGADADAAAAAGAGTGTGTRAGADEDAAAAGTKFDFESAIGRDQSLTLSSRPPPCPPPPPPATSQRSLPT